MGRTTLILIAALITGTALSACAPGAGTDATFDARFIDSMIEHHEGAVTMAQEALEQAEREEIRTLSEAIIAAQQAEIDQMKAWREQWYPGLAPTSGLDLPMGHMHVSTSRSLPYDLRFIDAMISHHEGAIRMAEAALKEAEHEEIRVLSEAIIAAQQAEIDQMKAWREAWAAETP